MNNNNGKNTPTAATKLRKALSCESVLAANGVCHYLDKYPEDMCEERTSWDVLKKYVTKLQYGFEALGAAINDALNTEVLPGNPMAMREALEAWIEYRNWGGYDALRKRGLRAQTKAALAAPPRNCDRFATAEDCFVEYFKTRNKGRFSHVVVMFADWLFAPAQEGGDHADA